MNAPTPSRDFLASQVRWAMGRGLPAQVAEDTVFAAWEKAGQSYDPRRGSFEAYMQKVVRNDCAYYWRRQARTRRAHDHLRLVPDGSGSSQEERAFRNQEALLEALQPDERRVFAAWALQKHLGKGQVTSETISSSLEMSPRDYENAKRRLKGRLQNLLAQLGWSVRELLYGEDDVHRAE